MHKNDLSPWHHTHSFGQEQKRPGEARTIAVILITGAMMVIEIAAGAVFHSMALLADGLHMASHAAALSISAFAYIYARRHAHDERFSFGTGKVNALGGYTGAILLAVFALLMAYESVIRLLHPVAIIFNQAIGVAVLGLLVNGVSVFILGHEDDHAHELHEQNGAGHGHHHDHNLRAAYFHVLADALTSILAILALLSGKYFGFVWMDPLMGIVGAILVARWSLGLLRSTTAVLLDTQASQHIQDAIREAIEFREDERIADLHLWTIGPNIYAAEIVVVAHDPLPPNEYKGRIPSDLGLEHVSVEVHRYVSNPAPECSLPVEGA